jgi:hypothetical protein
MRIAYFWLAACVAGWFVFFALAYVFPSEELGTSYVVQAGSLLVGLVILMSIVLAGERPRFNTLTRVLMFLGGTAAMLVPYLLNLQSPPLRALATLGLLAAALPIGYWIGDRMEKVTNLVPLAVAMSVADIYSVMHGPSHQVGEQLLAHYHEVGTKIAELGSHPSAQQAAETAASVRAPLADFIVVHIPLAGLHTTVPVLGIGDFIALAFLFRVAWLHRLRPRGVFVAALIAIVAALVISLLSGRVIPALPFIALGVVGWLWLTTPRLRRLDRQEVLLTIGVAALFGALMLGKWASGLMQH